EAGVGKSRLLAEFRASTVQLGVRFYQGDSLTYTRLRPLRVVASMVRDMLYIADEIFFTGTAAEITPVRSVDRISIGSGSRGPITKAVQDAFFAVTSGRTPDRHGWLTPIKQTVSGD
ncbi:MAG: hypothetical protein IH587_08725, partial [Anaerolineae bacterium]|nr:hypothetical protein [Anaerolineae bacterium]